MNLSNILFITLALLSTSAIAQSLMNLSDDDARTNYSVGFQVGSDFRIQKFELDPDAVMAGIKDALAGNEPKLTPEERKKALSELGNKVVERKKQMRELVANSNEMGQEFLNKNASKPGVITTASGLQYRIIEEGTGQRPGVDDKVLVHYRGRLIDGTEFDSSYRRNRPASFRVNQVIKGWTEALQLMPRGSKWQLVIPPELAYGVNGAGEVIPPNSTLIFDVELIAIQGN
jgi:FKBP-type peptidyl-prolyl cis-trans isomerase FklB